MFEIICCDCRDDPDLDYREVPPRLQRIRGRRIRLPWAGSICEAFRQLRDWKYSIAIEALIPHGMRIYGEICGWALARAYARSGDRIAIAAYLGSSDVFDQASTAFAAAYADQNERDHQALVDAVSSGRLTAEPDL